MRVNVCKGQTGSDPCSALPSGKITFDKGRAVLALDDATYKRCKQFAAERTPPYGYAYIFADAPDGQQEQTVVVGHVSTRTSTPPHHSPYETTAKLEEAPAPPADLAPVPEGFVNLQEACKIAGMKPTAFAKAVQGGLVKVINQARTKGEPEATYFAVSDLLKLKKGD
jgi:hypothetical protein